MQACQAQVDKAFLVALAMPLLAAAAALAYMLRPVPKVSMHNHRDDTSTAVAAIHV